MRPHECRVGAALNRIRFHQDHTTVPYPCDIYFFSKARLDMRKSYRQIGRIALAGVTTAWLAGCTAARTAHSAHANAPGLQDDVPLASRGGSNPNAPFMVVDHTIHLVKRPALLDVNAAAPCVAANLSLFESGAHVDGDQRSVRLNLVNHAKEPCRVGGYPSISLLRPDGSLIGSIAIQRVTATTIDAALHPRAAAKSTPAPGTVGGQAAPAPGTVGRQAAPAHSELASPAVLAEQAPGAQPSPYVLLAPMGEATFEIGWTSGEHCDHVGAIAVAAPGTLQSFTVRHELTVCQGRILVTAINDGAQL
jgi:hypothetical protein